MASEDRAGFCADWPALCDRIAPTGLRKQLGTAPVFNQVTPDWVRFDVAVGTPEDIPGRSRATVRPLYDPQQLSGRLADPRPAPGPDPQRVQAIGIEFLRVLGLLPVVIGRQECLIGVSGVELLRSMIIQLMLQDVPVEDRGGALHLNRLLPADRRQALTGLPAVSATREAVITGHLACAAVFLPLARDLHRRCRLAWPQELEDALRRHLSGTLAIELAG